MKPIGPLMWEHRLIEQIIPLIRNECIRLEAGNPPNILFIETSADFFRTYADRTHHGKEEDILFKALNKKNLSPEHESIMKELIGEHETARTTVKELLKAKEAYLRNESSSLDTILQSLDRLSELYPGHIEKEDKKFFYPAMEYFSNEEQEKMLDEFYAFDRSMIHEKYNDIINRMGGKPIKFP
ncbi:MAG: hemerythrin domain-containing protein [Syntrophales bacterium]|jgi:hemerythrin-like domain-containing protein|nr:hemerythrin domain-containing protein [Syntrophales bacterium]MDY0044064.1 hemerythrin domain-containing protein [Syntrophales bacterium]